MNKEEIIKTARFVNVEYATLDEALDYLQFAKELKQNVYIQFQHRFYFYSLLDDKESCLNTIKAYHKEQALLQKQQNKALESKQDYLEAGKSFMYPEKYDRWEKWINRAIPGFFNGEDVKISLAVMDILNSDLPNSMQVAIEFMHRRKDQFDLFEWTVDIITEYAKNGPEFARNLYAHENIAINESKEAFIKRIENENEIYAQNEHMNNETEESVPQ